jgi:DNA-binding transcriptional LysR family regulator
MTLLQLKYISTVAKCGSFSKAAQELYVTQPGISKMVRSMENELGITIFVRSSSGITLTAEGRELLNMGNRLLNDAEHITQHFRHDVPRERETLNVSCQHFCFVVDALSNLQNKSVSDSYIYKLLIVENPEVIQHVASKESELGVLFMGNHNQKFMERSFEENGLEYHELIKSTPYVFLHESHPLASREKISLEDLQEYPCIMYNLNMDSPSILHEEFFITDFYPKKVNIVSSLYQSVQVMTQCGGYDMGCGVISPSNKALGIIKRPVDGFDMELSIGWIHRKYQELSPIAVKFVKELEALTAGE